MTIAPSLYWTDPGRLAELARRATGSSGAVAARAVAERLPPITPVEPPPIPRTGGLEERLNQVLDWLDRALGVRSSFVVDPEGLPLDRRRTEDPLMASAAAVAVLWDALSLRFGWPSHRHVTLDLGGNLTLHLISVSTRWGLATLGFAIGQSVPAATLNRVRAAFAACVEDRGTSTTP